MAARKKQARRKRATRKTAAARTRGGSAGRGGRRATPAASAGPGGAYPEVEELVELMDRHGLLEVDYETGTDGVRRIRVSRGGAAHAPGGHLAPASPAWSGGAAASASAGEPAAGAHAAGADREVHHAFKSPMVGTFYRAPSPESPPFVSVGDPVDATTTVCIIEAMKVMNEIVPDVSGEVVSIEVENGEAVEYGQTLFLIRTG